MTANRPPPPQPPDSRTARPPSAPRLVLVTGATGGIGAVVCERLAERHLHPLIGHRAPRAADAQALALRCGGTPVALDLSCETAIDAAVAVVAARPEGLFGVIHCASPAPCPCPFGKITEAEMLAFWRANVLGPHRLFAGLIKHSLRRARHGVIVALTSQAMGGDGTKAMAGMGAYTVSKFGLSGVLALMAAEFPWLRVETVSPGFTRTKMLKAFDDRFIAMAAQHAPLSEPEAVAAFVMRCLDGGQDGPKT